MWLERLDKDGLWLREWMRHQRRGVLDKHGSVAEDCGAIPCPASPVGGLSGRVPSRPYLRLGNRAAGRTAGCWCPYGVGHDQAIDERREAGGSLVFDTAPLAGDIEVLGAPVVELDVSADRPNALLACTLSEILPGGAVSRVTYGLLNLTHRESHEHPAPLEPGKRYRVRVQMNHCGHRFAAGTRL